MTAAAALSDELSCCLPHYPHYVNIVLPLPSCIQTTQVWKYPRGEDIYVDDDVYVFARGPFVIVLTNVGQTGPVNSTVLTLTGLPKRFHGSRLRNVFDKQV